MRQQAPLWLPGNGNGKWVFNSKSANQPTNPPGVWGGGAETRKPPAARFAIAFHRRQLSLYSSKKIVEVAPAVTQGGALWVTSTVRRFSFFWWGGVASYGDVLCCFLCCCLFEIHVSLRGLLFWFVCVCSMICTRLFSHLLAGNKAFLSHFKQTFDLWSCVKVDYWDLLWVTE